MAISPGFPSSVRRGYQPSAISARGTSRGSSMPSEHERRNSLTVRDDKVVTKLKEFEGSTATIFSRLATLEKFAEERSSRSPDIQECLRSVRGLQKEVGHITEALQRKVGLPELQEVSQTLGGMEEAIARLSEMASVGSERLRQLERIVQDQLGEKKVSGGSERMQQLERSMQDQLAVAAEDMHRLRNDVRNTQGQLEQSIAVWAKSKGREATPVDAKQIWENLNDMQSKVRALEVLVQKNIGDEQIPEMRSAIASMQNFLTSRNQFQDLNGTISSKQLQDVKNALREMARDSDLQELKKSFSDTQKQLAIVDKVAHDRVSVQRLQQHSDALHHLEKKVDDIQKEFSAGVFNIQNTRGAMAAMQTKLGRLEHNSSVDCVGKSGDDIDELRHGIESVKSQVCSLDQLIRSKADATQLQSLGDAVQSIELKLARSESRLQSTGQAPPLEGDEARVLDVSITTFKTQLRDLEQATAEKVDMTEYRQVKSIVTNLQAQLASLTQVSQENVGMDTVQQFKTSIISIQAQMHNLKQELGEKADGDSIQKLKGAFSNMQINITNLQQSVQERAGNEQMQQLCASVAEAKSKLSSIEQHKAEASALQQLQDTIAAMQSKLPTSERVQQLESTLTSLGRHVTSLEQGKLGKAASVAEQAGFADVHTQVELQHFKGVIAGMEKKVTDIEQELQDKVSKTELQQCRKANLTLDTKLISLEQLLSEKAGTVQLQQVQGMLQTSISSVEQSVHEKIGLEQLQPLKASISGVQANVASVEQSLHEKAGASQIQQLKGSLAMVQNKTCGLEQALQEKAPAFQVQQLKDALCGVQTKVSTVEQTFKANNNALADDNSWLAEMPPRLKRLRALEGQTEKQL